MRTITTYTLRAPFYNAVSEVYFCSLAERVILETAVSSRVNAPVLQARMRPRNRDAATMSGVSATDLISPGAKPLFWVTHGAHSGKKIASVRQLPSHSHSRGSRRRFWHQHRKTRE